MSREKNILLNFILYLSTMLLVIIVGISDVFADTTVDTSQFFSLTGRKWSDGTLEFTGSPQYNNDWLLNAYNITGGIYTPPNQYDYIEFLYFEHNTSPFNPCNSSSKFTADFSLLFTNPSFVDYISSVKWNNDNCSITEKNNTTGIVSVSCIASPSTNNYTGLYVNFNTISGTNQSYLYVSRDIDISCGLNTDAIINNDNSNTQNIINNNNQNTQDLINNNNQNTQTQIESQQVCNTFIYDSSNVDLVDRYLTSSGGIGTQIGYNISPFIDINSSALLSVVSSGYNNACFYDSNKSFISCFTPSTSGANISIPTNARYFRYTIRGTFPSFSLYICKNGNQALDDSINGLNDSLNDDDTDGATSEASDFFDSFTTDTFGLTSIITAPLNLIQSLTSSTCNDLELPLPYLDNKKLTLPCMSTIYQQYFGTFFTIYQTITYGIIAYWVCVRIFNQVKDFKNPEHDEIEVVDL